MTAHTATRTDDTMNSNAKSFVRYLPTAARILMGLGFFASGLFGLLIATGAMAMPQPPAPPPERVAAFMEGIFKSGYMFPLIKVTELAVGALLLANRFVPLALAIIAPVLVNIIAFHAFLAPSGIAPGAALLLLEIYLAWAYRDAFRPMLVARASPSPR